MTDTTLRLIQGDCRDVMEALEPGSVHAIITDPPYELGFMGKAWDSTGVAYDQRSWQAALHVLKPGGHLLAFGGSRTYHRMAVAIEDAGFEIRDSLMWLYGKGFPKSHDVSQAIDRAAGADRQDVYEGGELGYAGNKVFNPGRGGNVSKVESRPVTNDAVVWSGWGTALKPAFEPVVMARKPFDGTVAANVLEHGTGAINVDAARIGDKGGTTGHLPEGKEYRAGPLGFRTGHDIAQLDSGRWPANVAFTHHPECQGSGARHPLLLCHPECPVRALEETAAGAPRYFYCGKARTRERIAGSIRNLHPTVKPVDLMRWLCRLVTAPGGVILDPFMGSGSTGCAAVAEEFSFVGVELEDESFGTSCDRIADWSFAHGGPRIVTGLP